MHEATQVGLPTGVTSLKSVINATHIDMWDDAQVMRQRFEHWILRGWKKLNENILRFRRSAFLKVDPNTHVAMLPKDFIEEDVVGYVNRGNLIVPFGLNANLAPAGYIVDPTLNNDCKCQCGGEGCLSADVKYELFTEEVVIDGNTYVKTIKKMILPDGRYLQETTQPVATYDEQQNMTVEMQTSTKELCQVQVKDCGCVLNTQENLASLCSCGCTCIFRGCDDLENAYPINHTFDGYYNVYRDLGIIQLNPTFCYDKLFTRYKGGLPVINGQYAVPEEAFEALVAFARMKYYENRRDAGAFRGESNQKWKDERKELLRNKNRFSILEIYDAIGIVPEP